MHYYYNKPPKRSWPAPRLPPHYHYPHANPHKLPHPWKYCKWNGGSSEAWRQFWKQQIDYQNKWKKAQETYKPRREALVKIPKTGEIIAVRYKNLYVHRGGRVWKEY